VAGYTKGFLDRFCVGATHSRGSLLRDSSVTGFYGLQIECVKGAPVSSRSSSITRDFGLDKPIREPTSGLEPLTCSLRVIGQVLQGLAQACKSRIDKLISFLRLAGRCTVLRSRWYQSGIKRLPLMHSRSLSQTSARSIRSVSSECEGTPHPWIATMFYPDGMNGGTRKGRGGYTPALLMQFARPSIRCRPSWSCRNLPSLRRWRLW
jgi:hypothetical protein